MARLGGKYAPLHAHLRALGKEEWHAHFEEIEGVLGFPLPRSARTYPAWWSNGSGMGQSAAWLDAGFRTADLNLIAGKVWFRRSQVSSDRKSRTQSSTAGSMPETPPAKADSSASAEGDLHRFAVAATNHQRVTEGFDLLTGILVPYVAQALRAAFGPAWWTTAVLSVLHTGQRRGLSLAGDDDELADQLDIARVFILMDVHWNAVFRDKLSREYRSWNNELQSTRNRWAYKGHRGMVDEDAWRALDTMIRMADEIDAAATARLRQLAQDVRSGRVHEPAVRCDLRLAWLPLGELRMDSTARLAFPDAPRRPGLYRFTLSGTGRPSIHVGETETLKRRFDNYRQPGPSQQTNLRINRLFIDGLERGARVFVAIIVDTAWITTQGVERPADLSEKAERVLLEHAAIVRAGSEKVEILNR